MGKIFLKKDIERERARIFYDSNYYDVASRILELSDFEYLGDEKLKKCRFCEKKEGEVFFDEKAHVLPECIGNEYLLSHYECDTCNKFFGNKIEGEYSNCFSFYHSLFKIKGKKKVPISQENGGMTRREWMRDPGNEKDIYVLRDIRGKETVEINQDKHIFTICGKSEAYLPIAVFKCFVKMAISIMPKSEVNNFKFAIKWIKEKEHHNFYENERKLLCRFVQLAGFSNRSPQYTLFKRKSISDYPYMLFQITYGSFSYLIEVPRYPSDIHLKTIEQIPFPPLYYETINEGSYDFSGTERISEARKVIFAYGNLDEEAGRFKVKQLFPKLQDKDDGSL